MKITSKLLISLACIAMLAGCARTAPILTPQTTIMTKNSLPTVKKAILEAGQKRKWVMNDVSPGIIDGLLKNRSHDVKIRITYTDKNYTIHYVSSQNLKAHDGNIHRNYNRWINSLDNDIQLRLAAMANQ
ncbi:conserved exported hypothetical protein [Xenorhabdus bovienii str. kraussei Quebec]|uniref:Lipoprotein n=1 Tax=Xenorhabdus bovienii str. kraussei Quebec TaxID=1398203 RepID=A0A077P1I9_XENBV|nr:hypothetical protein [Xenorhabdus bovienii]MDE9445965.1 hypothetical protein [Xenorhabdus bovienii]CDH18220.1 conserved exported hypothetical protein [Xenorhabdus bovienii str. kraussei Quebec]